MRKLSFPRPSPCRLIPVLSRHGVTLVELLIVISIVGILVTLLLPAVQTAREAARNMQCKDNLRQIGVALNAHYSARNSFPPGYYASPPEANHRADEATWITFSLPYLENNNLYEQIDWTHQFGIASAPPDHWNRQITSARIREFICPSSIEDDELVIGGFYARGNYAANNGIGPMRESTSADLPPKRPAGVFYLNSKSTFAKIPDGSSKTALVSELRVVLRFGGIGQDGDWRGIMHFPEGPLYQHNYPPNSSMPDKLREIGCTSVPEAPCEGAFPSWDNRQLIMTARSAHAGGVNLLLGDGRVEFVSDEIDLSVWQALSTTNAVAGEPYVHLP
jgi:prepilin-type N-terminal cleavage/methylation domain-containing protein